MPDMGKLKEYAALTGTVLGILTVIVGAAFWLKSLEDRVESLEKVVIAAPSQKGIGGNPVQEACGNLAKRATTEGYTDAQRTKDAMDALGCRRAGNP